MTGRSTAVEHVPRIFINSQMPPEERYRGECECGWSNGSDPRGSRYYTTERATKIGLSIHARRATAAAR